MPNGTGGYYEDDRVTGEHTTVTKCPACGKVTVGMPSNCPACTHIFTKPDANLPAVRDQTTEFQTRQVLERTHEVTSQGLPRHIVVPVIAGLLVAVVVVVIVRLNVEDLRQSGAATGIISPSPTEGTETGESRPEPGDIATQPQRKGGVPSLGPGARRIAPTGITLAGSKETESGPREAVLTDGSPDTCYFTDGASGNRPLIVRFPHTYRFSHVLFHVSCLRTTHRDLRGEITLTTDDGTARTVQIPGVSGPTWVDLAGAWTRRLEIDLTGSSFDEIGLGELEFFAFDD